MIKFRKIVMYETDAGKCPVAEFLEEIRIQAVKARIVKVFEMVEQLPFPPTNYLKKLVGSGDLWEVRATTSHQSFRFLGFYDGKNLVLTNAFAKQTDKTPLHEIALAKRRQEMYFGGQRKLP